MAPKSLEECEVVSSERPTLHLRIFPIAIIPITIEQFLAKHMIPRSYVSFNSYEKERYLTMLKEIDSYYTELTNVYDAYPEFAERIYFSENRFKCLMEYLMFLEDKLFKMRNYGVSCKRRRLVCEV